MWKDEIVEETRLKREAYAAQFNYDLEAMYLDLKEQERQGHRKTVTLSPKQPLHLEIARPVKAAA